MRKVALLALSAALLELEAPAPALPPDLNAIGPEAAPSLLATDHRAMIALESRGLSLAKLFGARRSTNDALAETPLFASLVATLERDLAELDARPLIGPAPLPNRPFKATWLRDRRARFELIGAVDRLDRKFLEPGCGEARLVYRLVFQPDGRPKTPLPMTINVVFPQPADGDGCRQWARAWTALPPGGPERVDALEALYRRLPPFAIVETNLQNLHGPATGDDIDDHAEYVLRSFDRKGDSLVPRGLTGTPRTDLDDASKDALVAWIKEHFAEIDEGTWVLPQRFLAERSISVAPRGLARRRNRPFQELLGGRSLGELPYAGARLVKSPRGLLRRLDQGTCSGCHQSRAIAGFHLVGEDRDPAARLNALVLPRSVHLGIDLRWRAPFVAAIAAGTRYDDPRPFTERRAAGRGGPGSHCALDADPTFAEWTCDEGLRCRDLNGDDVGVCVPAEGPHEGDACQDARLEPRGDDPRGDRVTAGASDACLLVGGVTARECSPNAFGFPGGNCSRPCATLGTIAGGGRFACADIPSTGYENECFTRPIPIEECMKTHMLRRLVARCDSHRSCRDDFVCARSPGLAVNEGVCVPPYFAFQFRVDGPVLDR